MEGQTGSGAPGWWSPRCEVCGATVDQTWHDDPDDPPGCWLCRDQVACQARLVADLDEGPTDWSGIPY